MRKYLCAALSPQTCKKRLRTAGAVSVSAELSMIAQTSEQRTLLTFCSAFAKCPKYGERLGAITQGEDLTSGTLRCAGVLYFFSLCDTLHMENACSLQTRYAWQFRAVLAVRRRSVLFRLVRHGSTVRRRHI